MKVTTVFFSKIQHFPIVFQLDRKYVYDLNNDSKFDVFVADAFF